MHEHDDRMRKIDDIVTMLRFAAQRDGMTWVVELVDRAFDGDTRARRAVAQIAHDIHGAFDPKADREAQGKAVRGAVEAYGRRHNLDRRN